MTYLGALNYFFSDYIYNIFLSSHLDGSTKFSIPQVTPNIIKVLISSLNSNKSVGLDTISVPLLRLFSDDIIITLCHIINCSIDNSTFPNLWKSAKVFAPHMGGSNYDFNNFRPISILSITSKIIERHVHDSFILYLNDNSLLCDAQSGFRKFNSCFTCIAKMINDWHENINNGCLVGCITLDFRKAFDVLSHDILIQKLALYGCDDISLSWFDSYLKNR